VSSDEPIAAEMSITEARANLPAAVQAAARRGRITYLTVYGKREALIGPVGLALPQSIADELRKLYALVDEGILTRAEFDAEKVRLLAREK
jgi:hypothetical protein